MLLALSTWQEIEDRLGRSKAVVVPIGSNEQHGPTGLLGTDWLCLRIPMIPTMYSDMIPTTYSKMMPTICSDMMATTYSGMMPTRGNVARRVKNFIS